MTVIVRRRRRFSLSGYQMRRSWRVIMPVPVDGSPPVAVRVEMPGKRSRFPAQGRVKWIILRRRFMVMPMPVIVAVLVVAMVILGELGLITVRMTPVIDDNRHSKLVGLRNLLDRFPIGSTIHKPEVLALVAFPTGLHSHSVGGNPGHPEVRRDARLEDR